MHKSTRRLSGNCSFILHGFSRSFGDGLVQAFSIDILLLARWAYDEVQVVRDDLLGGRATERLWYFIDAREWIGPDYECVK